MKKLITTIKNFRYKLLLGFIIMIISIILDSMFETNIFNSTASIIFGTICTFIFIGFWVGVYNIWTKDDDKVMAIVFGLAGTIFVSILTYLMFFV